MKRDEVDGLDENEKAIVMFELMDSFPVMNNQKFTAWDPKALEHWATHGASGGEKIVIRFLLHVWNQFDPWECGRFDLIEAYTRLDEDNFAAIQRWVADPFTL